MSIEALKLALEAFGEIAWSNETQWQRDRAKKAITAIREALAQPEQEPVAWSYWQSCLNDDGTQTAPWVHRLSKFKPNESIINKDIVPLYTTPPQRKPLTDEEIGRIAGETLDAWSCARAIEAAHGIWPENSDCYGPDWTDRDGEYLK